MRIESIDSVLTRLIQSPSPRVLAMKGSWGVGKTHHWDEILRKHKRESGRTKYAYVSLFGLSSITELRTAIFTKTTALRTYGEKIDPDVARRHWRDLLSNCSRAAGRFLRSLRDISPAKNFTAGLDVLAPLLTRDTLICLDDFERLNSDRIKPDEVLGLISELKEEKNCSILLIFNEDELKEKDVYLRYREKVVDYEVKFLPSPTEAIDIAFPPDMPFRQGAVECAKKLGASNIRVLRKIDDLLRQIEPTLHGLHDSVANAAVSALVLCCWAQYSRSERVPSLEFLDDFSTLSQEFEANAEDRDPRRTEWTLFLRTYGWLYTDDLDRAIIKVVTHGYVEESGFPEEASKASADAKNTELREEFYAAWRPLHDSFLDNEEEVVRSIATAFKKSVKRIPPNNVDETVCFLRWLNRDELADDLLAFYVEQHLDTPEAFDRGVMETLRPTKDVKVRETFKAMAAKFHIPPAFDTVVKSLIDRSGWNEEDFEVMSAASMDDYYSLFKADHGRDLQQVLRVCMQFKGDGRYNIVAVKAQEALERIESESRLNRWRVANLLNKEPEV